MEFYPNYFEVGRRIKSRAAQNEYYGAIIRYYFEGMEPSFKSEAADIAFAGVRISLEKQRAGRVAGIASATKRATDGPTDEATTEPTTEATDGPTDAEQANKRTSNKRTSTVSPKAPYSEIISYLNERTNKHFKSSSKETQRLINGRWSEGYRLDDFKRVIDIKADEWTGTELEKYLRPDTLFRPSKFEGYLNQKPREGADFDYSQYD